MRPRTVVRWVHLWAGLVLSVLLLVLGVTGSVLVYKEAYWRMVHPALAAPYTVPTVHEAVRAIARADELFGPEVRSVKFPGPGLSAYHLYLDDGEAFLSATDLQLVDRWRPGERPMALLFDLHAHLMAGEGGERVGGVVAILGAFMVLTGVWLWWPARRRFRVRTLLPSGLTRRRLLPSHRDLGMVAAPLLLLLCLTGAGIVFYGTAGAVLRGILPGGDPLPEEAPAAAPSLPAPERADAGLLDRVSSEFPDARLVFYYPPRDGDRLHGFRLQRPCELHPNGRTYLYLDASGAVVRRTDACDQPSGQRALHALYPLHAGKVDSDLYAAAVFLSGLALSLISFTGAAAYLSRIRKGPRAGG